MQAPDPTRPARILSTAPGTHREAFGVREWLMLAAIASMWGSSFLFIELGLLAFPPPLIAGLRIAFGVLTLALIPRSRRPIPRSELPRLVLLAAIWQAIPLLLFPIAQQTITSSLAGMLNGSMPLFSALFATVLLRHAPGRTQIAGLVVGFVGTALIAVGAGRLESEGWTGIVLVLVAVVGYGLSVNLAVPLQQRYGSLPVLLRVEMLAFAMVAPFAAASLPDARWDPQAFAAVLALGVFGTGLAFVLMAELVGRVGAARGSVAIYFIPVVAIVLGVTILDEPLVPSALAGTALVLVGAWLTSRSEGVASERR